MLSFMVLTIGCSSSSEDPKQTRGTVGALNHVPTGQQALSKGRAQPRGAGPSTRVLANIYFLDSKKVEAGDPDPLTAVRRDMNRGDLERNVLHYLFKGPTAEEQARGLLFSSSGSNGYTNVIVQDGGVSVQLKGGCSSQGGVVTVYDQIERSLEDLDSVAWVKVRGPDGQTQHPDTQEDSRPDCLEP